MPDGIGQMRQRKLVMGVVTGAHGVRGLVRVKSFTAAPEDLTAYGPLTDASGAKVYGLTVKGFVKGQLLVAIDGCTARSDADALKGTEFFIDRDLLPEIEDGQEFYHADLIGLTVMDADGREIGMVRAVFDFGSGDMLEVLGSDGKVTLHAFTQAVVPEINLDSGRLTIIPAEDASEPDADIQDGIVAAEGRDQ